GEIHACPGDCPGPRQLPQRRHSAWRPVRLQARRSAQARHCQEVHAVNLARSYMHVAQLSRFLVRLAHSIDNKQSLMHYVVRWIEKHEPEILSIGQQLNGVSDAMKIPLTALTADLA